MNRTAIALVSMLAPVAYAQQATQQLDSVQVHGRAALGAADSASEGEVKAERLAQRPLLRPAELLEAMPGMIVTQHSGDGKANQYFLRGFNLDHGSDFATTVMGMPANMASHAHGQGYMDLNFLIPELVSSLQYRKGSYAAEDGDFVTTGSARIAYTRQIDAPFVELTAGPDDYRRGLVAGSTKLGDSGWQLLGALESSRYDGPWEQPEALRRGNGVLRLSKGDADNGIAISALSYSARWHASEHVPERAIRSGEVGRYGTLLRNDGGITHRHSLSVEWARSEQAQDWRASAYVIDNALNLFSGASGYIKGPDGDQHEQADHRRIYGGQLRHGFAIPSLGTDASWGLQWRQDRISELGLYDTVDRQRTHTVRADQVEQNAVGLFAEARTQINSWLRGSAGLRWDRLSTENRAIAGEFNLDNGGRASKKRWSPKLGLVARVAADTELYAQWGRGFRSNDVRGATSALNPNDGSPQDLLPLLARTQSHELGLRVRPAKGWNSSLVLWQARLDSELVFVGDEGVTEARGASRRSGLEWSNDFAPTSWLLIDADMAWSRARFVHAENGGRHVPNAIPVNASLSATVVPAGPWFGGLKLRYLGSYALEETGTEKSATNWTANLKLGYRLSTRTQISLDVLNLFDRRANDIEYWGGACTRAEGPGCGGGEGIDGRLVHPMEARTLRVSLRSSF
ncbi:TonB-dependent receptor [Roseateles cavernae]|uniref:TonB-dependent receptor n=1 Tax=Roseateles cavernae TaxID=3153578 RepID=UPI0032E425E1